MVFLFPFLIFFTLISAPLFSQNKDNIEDRTYKRFFKRTADRNLTSDDLAKLSLLEQGVRNKINNRYGNKDDVSLRLYHKKPFIKKTFKIPNGISDEELNILIESQKQPLPENIESPYPYQALVGCSIINSSNQTKRIECYLPNFEEKKEGIETIIRGTSRRKREGNRSSCPSAKGGVFTNNFRNIVKKTSYSSYHSPRLLSDDIKKESEKIVLNIHVKDEEGQSISNANVMIKELFLIQKSDQDGKVSLNLKVNQGIEIFIETSHDEYETTITSIKLNNEKNKEKTIVLEKKMIEWIFIPKSCDNTPNEKKTYSERPSDKNKNFPIGDNITHSQLETFSDITSPLGIKKDESLYSIKELPGDNKNLKKFTISNISSCLKIVKKISGRIPKSITPFDFSITSLDQSFSSSATISEFKDSVGEIIVEVQPDVEYEVIEKTSTHWACSTKNQRIKVGLSGTAVLTFENTSYCHLYGENLHVINTGFDNTNKQRINEGAQDPQWAGYEVSRIKRDSNPNDEKIIELATDFSKNVIEDSKMNLFAVVPNDAWNAWAQNTRYLHTSMDHNTSAHETAIMIRRCFCLKEPVNTKLNLNVWVDNAGLVLLNGTLKGILEVYRSPSNIIIQNEDLKSGKNCIDIFYWDVQPYYSVGARVFGSITSNSPIIYPLECCNGN